MSQRKKIEAFNRYLDELLLGDETDPSALPEADQQLLGIARRLAALDLSAQSKQRFSLRRKLAQNAHLRNHVWARASWRPSISLQATWAIGLPSATLLFVLVFVLGWTLANLGRPPASGDLVTATALAIPGSSIESELPPLGKHSSEQAFVPQPLPTPIAPRQSTTQRPTTAGPDQTPQLTSWRTGRTGDIRVNP